MAKPTEQITALRGKLAEFLAIKQENLISRPQWGDLTFENAREDIDSIYGVVHLLNGLPLEKLPAAAAQQITGALTQALTFIALIDKFSLHEGSPVQNQQEITNNLANVQEQLYAQTHQWIPFLAYLKGDIPAQLDAIAASVLAAESKNGDFHKYLNDRQSEIDAAVSAAREASARAGAAHFTKDFLADSKERDKDAKNWLTAAIAAAAVTIIVAVVFFFVTAPDDPYSIVQFTTSKLVILAMLIGITAWCAGNFRANKHQATVSRHKGHSLQTFQAFVEASDNPVIRDAVLLETTRSIFSHFSTGYLKSDATNDSPSRVFEVFKEVGDKGGSGQA